jgi:hypothetical protein
LAMSSGEIFGILLDPTPGKYVDHSISMIVKGYSFGIDS